MNMRLTDMVPNLHRNSLRMATRFRYFPAVRSETEISTEEIWTSTFNEICEFVIRTKARPGRKHASIGVANPTFKTITNDMVQHGLSQELINFIPWLTMDGINDVGLVCNINVVNKDDIKSYPHEHTNAGKPKIMVMNLVRALLDNCGSVEEAKEFIADHDITPIPAGWDGHIMIADPSTTVIAEFTGEKGAEVKYTETEIMTNFYNHIYAATGKYPPHGCGTERYDILKAGYKSDNSMNGMWELLKRVRYTKTYKTSTDPFWCSDLYDQIPTFDQHPVEYWTKEKILEQEKLARQIEAYKLYEETSQYDLKDELWFTTHNSTYDINKKILRVTVREKYESYYEFSLN